MDANNLNHAKINIKYCGKYRHFILHPDPDLVSGEC